MQITELSSQECRGVELSVCGLYKIYTSALAATLPRSSQHAAYRSGLTVPNRGECNILLSFHNFIVSKVVKLYLLSPDCVGMVLARQITTLSRSFSFLR